VNWFRCDGFGFNAGELARVCTVDFTLICIGHCVVKTCLHGSLSAKAIETKARGNIGAYIEGKQDPVEWKQTPRSILDAEQ
jgi:hypothetical protein